MPKEFIECQDFGRMIPVANTPGEAVELAEWDKTAVKVGWSRDAGHVELAVVECVDGAFIEHAFQLSGAPTIGEAPVSAGPFMEVPAEIWHGAPRYIQLDRNGINRLIRTLRKARDAAYGSDA